MKSEWISQFSFIIIIQRGREKFQQKSTTIYSSIWSNNSFVSHLINVRGKSIFWNNFIEIDDNEWIFLRKLFCKIYLCLLKVDNYVALFVSDRASNLAFWTLFPPHYPPLTLFLSRESCDRFKSTAIVSRKWWPLMDFNVDSASINNELVGSWWTWWGMNIYGERNGFGEQLKWFFFFYFVWRSINFYKRMSNNYDIENYLW